MFKIDTTKDGRYHFSIYSKNRTIIATGQCYKTKASADKGVVAVKKYAPIAPIVNIEDEPDKKVGAPRFEIFKDKKGEWRFRLIAKNSQVIAQSEGYKKKGSARAAILAVRKNAVS